MPAIGGRQVLSISYRDATGELGTFRIFFDEITVASLPGLLSDLGDFTLSTDAITLGIRAKESWGEETTISNAVPTNNVAQRESKLLVQYQGAVTEKPYTLTIPTIDPDVLVFMPNAGDAVAFTAATGASAAIQTWVAAFEALASAPDNEAEGVVVTGMRFVGRNT
jgi:hypothetical protein